MAIVSDRKQIFLREIEALNHQKRQILEQVSCVLGLLKDWNVWGMLISIIKSNVASNFFRGGQWNRNESPFPSLLAKILVYQCCFINGI